MAVLVPTALLVTLVAFTAPAQAESRMWVAGENAKRRSCPSMKCGIVGALFYRETVIVYERVDEWSRISGYSTAGCYKGESTFVQSGRNDCSEENGISNGKFAEWVRSDFLVSKKPAYEPGIEG